MTGGNGRIGAGVGGTGLRVGVGAAACLGDALDPTIDQKVGGTACSATTLTLLAMQTLTTLMTALAAGLSDAPVVGEGAEDGRNRGMDGDGDRNGVFVPKLLC